MSLVRIVLLLLAVAAFTQPRPVPAEDPPAPEGTPADTGSSPANPTVIEAGRQRWDVPPAQPANRQQVKHLQELHAALTSDRPAAVDWLTVLPPIQAILASREDSYVTPDSRGRVVIAPYQLPLAGLKDVADRMLDSLPPRGLESWRRLYSAAAQSQLTQAESQLDLIRVALQFPRTPAAGEAASRLGSLSLDQQRPASALFWFQRLHRSPQSRDAREPLLSLKTAAAWSSLWRVREAGSTLRDLRAWLKDHPDKRSPLTNALDEAANSGEQALINWLVSRVPVAVLQTPETGWTHFLGSPSRTMNTQPVNPLTGPAWRSSTIGLNEVPTAQARQLYVGIPDRYPDSEFPQPRNRTELAAAIERGLEVLSLRDSEQQKLTFPASHPLIVGDRAVFRTLNRIRCVHLRSGEILWETFTDDPAWADLFDLSQTNEWKKLPVRDVRSPINQFQEALLRIRTRQDRTLGTLTADRRQVYFVDECGVPDRTVGLSQRMMTRASPQPFNRLCAADLQTGQLRWELGGPRDDFALDEAGGFFLGPPSIVDDELFVLVERDAGIQLLCLKPESGELKWSQAVSQPIESVQHLSLRRVSADSPTLAGDLLLCPTTSGLLVAFSPDRQRIEWTFQYPSSTRPVPRSRRVLNVPTTVSSGTMDSRNRWSESTLLTSGGRVLLAPVDANELFCLDVLNGRLLWKTIRNKGLSLACVTNGYVVVTTTYGLQALQLDDGSPAWEARLEGYAPAGRGVRIGSQFHLPATFPIDPDAGEGVPRPKGILTVDLDTGRVLIASRLDDPALSGNLAAFNGTLVSAGFNAVAAFEPLSHLEQQLAGGSANPNDARVPAMRGRLALHQGRVEEGIELLRKAALLDENSDAQGDLVFAVLEKLRNREIVAERALELLEGIEVKGRQRTVFSRLRAESLANSEKHLDAFRAFIELGRDTPVDSGLILNPDNVVSTAGRRWVASRLAGIHDSVRKSNQDDLLALETLIQKPLTDGQPTVDDLRRWLELFAWHEQASDVRLQLSRFLLRKTGDVPLLEAEQLLSRVVNSPESALAAEARKELIEVWIRSGQAESAVADFEQLKADWNSRSPGGLNAESLIEKWSREEQVKRLLGRGDWARTAPATKTETIFKRFEHRYILPVIGDPGPAFSGWTFEINLVRNVFLARGPLGKERWSIRVTGPDGGVPRVHPAATSVHCQGHLVVLSMSSRFLVYDASGKTTKELWNRSLLPRDNAQLFLVPQKRGLGGYRLQTHDERPIGSVDLVLSDSVVYRKGRVLHLARLDDGQVLWQRDDVEPEAVVIGNEQSLAVLDLEANTAELLAPFDGSSKQQSAFSPIGRLIAAAGTDPVATMSGNDTLQLARFDAATGKPVWSFEYSPNALMRVIRGRNIVILDPDGRIHVRDADTGALRVETRGNGFQQLSAFQVLETAGGFVLLTSVPTESTSRIPVPLGLQGVVQPRVNSDAYGIDWKQGVVWHRKLGDQLISLSQPRDLPSFVLASERRVYNREQRRIESIDFPIEIIDSRSGRTVFEQTLKNRTMGYRLDADLDAQTIRYTFDRLQIDLDYLQPDE